MPALHRCEIDPSRIHRRSGHVLKGPINGSGRSNDRPNPSRSVRNITDLAGWACPFLHIPVVQLRPARTDGDPCRVLTLPEE